MPSRTISEGCTGASGCYRVRSCSWRQFDLLVYIALLLFETRSLLAEILGKSGRLVCAGAFCLPGTSLPVATVTDPHSNVGCIVNTTLEQYTAVVFAPSPRRSPELCVLCW